MSGPSPSSDQMIAKPGTVRGLDGLRATSILIVLAAHFVDPNTFPGGLGVYIFFVISGFLITRLLLIEQDATHTISIHRFYLRRIIRLYPVILTFTACVIALNIVLGRPYNLIEPASGLGYFANYLYVYLAAHKIQQQMPFGAFWSLSVEEHFYILFPVVFMLLRGDPRRLMWIIMGLCVGCLALRVEVARLHPDYLNTSAFYTLSQYRLDSIAFGVMLALICQLRSGRRVVRLMAQPVATVGALMVLAACLLVRDPWFRETFRYTLIGGAIDVLLAPLLVGNSPYVIQQVLNSGIMMWIGRLSYSLYIWHEGVSSLFPDTGITWQIVTLKFAGTLVVAVISYYVVERPFLQLRRYLRSPQSGSVRPAPPQLQIGLRT